ncbi:MAG TPA: hypothetical protein VMV37_04575 [Gammaproteobacteria bacterium]|nr:hypothetical protein [Gammaproteobacteria bacterium]
MRDDLRRLDDLLLARATTGLADAEAAELDGLVAAHPEVDADAYERAAAVVCLATLDSSIGLPSRLRRALEERAAEFVAASGSIRR